MSDVAHDGRTEPEDEDSGVSEGEAQPGSWRLRDHVGVLSGWILGLLFAAILALLAVAGDAAALAILVVMAIGTTMIVLGMRMRGGRR